MLSFPKAGKRQGHGARDIFLQVLHPSEHSLFPEPDLGTFGPTAPWWGSYTRVSLGSGLLLEVKESTCNEGDLRSIPGVRKIPLEKRMETHSSFLLENSTDRRAWRVAKSQT